MWQKYIHSDPAGTLPYFVYTPANYRVRKPVPLIVMMHGCTQTAASFAASTRMNELAEQHHFIVVYPQQTNNNNRSLCWNWFKPSNQVRNHGKTEFKWWSMTMKHDHRLFIRTYSLWLISVPRSSPHPDHHQYRG